MFSSQLQAAPPGGEFTFICWERTGKLPFKGQPVPLGGVQRHGVTVTHLRAGCHGNNGQIKFRTALSHVLPRRDPPFSCRWSRGCGCPAVRRAAGAAPRAPPLFGSGCRRQATGTDLRSQIPAGRAAPVPPAGTAEQPLRVEGQPSRLRSRGQICRTCSCCAWRNRQMPRGLSAIKSSAHPVSCCFRHKWCF